MDSSRPVANPYELLPPVPEFELTSTDMTDGQPLAEQFTADGGGVSPQMSWTGYPKSTRSFMVTCFDPDAPDRGFWHWLLLDLPASTTELPRGAGSADGSHLPDGAFHTPNDAGTLGYSGPDPAPGDRRHRYYFAVHALEVEKLDVDASADPAAVSVATWALPRTIARAFIAPTYQR